MNNMEIRKGDNVLVLTGKDKGKTGTVISASPKSGKVVVMGVNVQKKHLKARSATMQGGIVDQNGPIDVSNVMIVCDKCKKATRIAHKEEAGKSVRVCKKCGAVLTANNVSEKSATAKAKKAKKSAE